MGNSNIPKAVQQRDGNRLYNVAVRVTAVAAFRSVRATERDRISCFPFEDFPV